MEKKRLPTITGDAELRSPWMSNRWTLTQRGETLATIRRLGRIYVSAVDLAGAGRLLIEPCGQGTVHALDANGAEVARIERQSWLGRRWWITGLGYNYTLVSDPRPRRWHITIANAPVATIEGSLMSYNRVDIRANLSLPPTSVLLAWHVIARPWEAATEPRGLIPVSRPGPA